MPEDKMRDNPYPNLILGHTLTVTGLFRNGVARGSTPGGKIKVIPKNWKSILKGRNFRKGLQKSRR